MVGAVSFLGEGGGGLINIQWNPFLTDDRFFFLNKYDDIKLFFNTQSTAKVISGRLLDRNVCLNIKNWQTSTVCSSDIWITVFAEFHQKITLRGSCCHFNGRCVHIWIKYASALEEYIDSSSVAQCHWWQVKYKFLETTISKWPYSDKVIWFNKFLQRRRIETKVIWLTGSCKLFSGNLRWGIFLWKE